MEPLVYAILKALTPPDVITEFIDERFEPITINDTPDLVVMSIRTFNANRAYELSKQFIEKGVKVLLGGYHVMLAKEEALTNASSIAIGNAEDVWENIINDLKKGELKNTYLSDKSNNIFAMPNREIYNKYKYLPLKPVETSRGCPYECSFCSTAAVYKKKIIYRDPVNVINEIKAIKRKWIMFTDENFLLNSKHTEKILSGLRKMKIQWIAQTDVSIANNEKMIKQMALSGCFGLLIGFESFKKSRLEEYRKTQNIKTNYKNLINTLHKYGIGIYASFIISKDDENSVDHIIKYIIDNRIELAGLSPLTPYPNTGIYINGIKSKTVIQKWWRIKPYPYWKFVFIDNKEKLKGLENKLIEKKGQLYSIKNILKRIRLNGFLNNPIKSAVFLMLNIFAAAEIQYKKHL